MYFYNKNISLEENFKKLLFDYNNLWASSMNSGINLNKGHDKNQADIDYVAMMTDVNIPTNEGGIQ